MNIKQTLIKIKEKFFPGEIPSELKENKILIEKIKNHFFGKKKKEFIDYKNNLPIKSNIKLIAFYLPQFHPFRENDLFWGKGFTEWTNVGRSLPHFIGHYQPHCPIHLGYYDLRIPEVMEEQARLAKNYGIYGFAYYFYWFDGKVLMEHPLKMMIANKTINMPFFFIWANENWTRRWNGREDDVLIKQNHSKMDSLKFIQYLIPYFQDDRYIRVNERPVLSIYRANIIPDLKETIDLWNKELSKHGIANLYLIAAQSFEVEYIDYFDASMQFPPHTLRRFLKNISPKLHFINDNNASCVFEYKNVVDHYISIQEPSYKLFRTAALNWDNTPRCGGNNLLFHNFNLDDYIRWLTFNQKLVLENDKYSSCEKFSFINAWNEWAEGTHLEPDQKIGYGYLQSTHDSILFSKKIALIIHLFYEELLDEFFLIIKEHSYLQADIYITVCSLNLKEKLIKKLPNASIILVENRGRDILPFIIVLDLIIPKKYDYVCKIHSKRTLYRSDGNSLRKNLLNSLLGSRNIVSEILLKFNNDDLIGIIAPKEFLLEHNNKNFSGNSKKIFELSSTLGVPFTKDVFPAGSMFWFRPNCLFLLSNLNKNIFEADNDQNDGQYAHAIERLFCDIAKNAGYTVEKC